MIRSKWWVVVWLVACATQGSATSLQGQVLERDLVTSRELLVGDTSWRTTPDSAVSGSSRVKWTLVGAGIGAAAGWLVAGPVNPFGDTDTRVDFAIGGALIGGLAGLILSGPSPEEEAESQFGSFGFFTPVGGGFGIAYFP